MNLIELEYTDQMIYGMQIQLNRNYAEKNPLDAEEMRSVYEIWLRLKEHLNLK